MTERWDLKALAAESDGSIADLLDMYGSLAMPVAGHDSMEDAYGTKVDPYSCSLGRARELNMTSNCAADVMLIDWIAAQLSKGYRANWDAYRSEGANPLNHLSEADAKALFDFVYREGGLYQQYNEQMLEAGAVLTITIAEFNAVVRAGPDTITTAPARAGPRRGEAPGSTTNSTNTADDLATEAAGGVDTGMVHGPPLGRPNFIASSNGEIVAVPEGAVGPTMAETGKGIQFTGGSGGRGLDPRVTDIRVMDPVTTGKYTYPDGYVSYSNAAGQTVSPVTGQTIGKSDPFWHWQWGPK